MERRRQVRSLILIGIGGLISVLLSLLFLFRAIPPPSGAPHGAPSPTRTAPTSEETPTLSVYYTPTPVCSGTPNTALCSNQSDLAIDVGSADIMQVQDTQEIRVRLYSISDIPIAFDPLPTANVAAENATVTTTPVVPVGTPGTAVYSAFGPDYLPYAIAKLTANTNQFSISPIFPYQEEQSVDQRAIVWAWLVTANKTGTSILDINISMIWARLDTKLPKQGPWSIGDQQIRIQVTEPIPTPTPAPSPSPTPSPIPTTTRVLAPAGVPTPTSSPNKTSPPIDGLQITANFAQVISLLYLAVFGGRAVYEVVGKRPRLRFPSKLTITNILLAAILLVLLSLLFRPHLIP